MQIQLNFPTLNYYRFSVCLFLARCNHRKTEQMRLISSIASTHVKKKASTVPQSTRLIMTHHHLRNFPSSVTSLVQSLYHSQQMFNHFDSVSSYIFLPPFWISIIYTYTHFNYVST